MSAFTESDVDMYISCLMRLKGKIRAAGVGFRLVARQFPKFELPLRGFCFRLFFGFTLRRMGKPSGATFIFTAWSQCFVASEVNEARAPRITGSPIQFASEVHFFSPSPASTRLRKRQMKRQAAPQAWNEQARGRVHRFLDTKYSFE